MFGFNSIYKNISFNSIKCNAASFGLINVQMYMQWVYLVRECACVGVDASQFDVFIVKTAKLVEYFTNSEYTIQFIAFDVDSVQEILIYSFPGENHQNRK